MPVTRLSENTDSGVISVAIRSPRNESRIVSPPTNGGSRAATNPRKTQNASTSSSGNAISSARSRSSSTILPTCSKPITPPPSCTWSSSSNSFSIRLAVLSRTWSSSGRKSARTYVAFLSRETIAGSRVW